MSACSYVPLDQRCSKNARGVLQQVEVGYSTTWYTIITRLGKLAAPLVLQNSLVMAISIMNTTVVGTRLGAQALASGLMANALYNITGLSMMMGLACGMETLCGQAFGAGNYRQVGIVLQRGIIVNLTAAVLVLLFIWLPIKPVLKAVGTSE